MSLGVTSSLWKKPFLGLFLRENLRFSRVLRSRHLSHEMPQAVRPQPARPVIFAFVALLAIVNSGRGGAAAELFWTANGSTLGGSGSWTATGSTWSPTSSPVAAAAWVDGSEAVFAGAGNALVTVESLITASRLTFASGGYTIAHAGGGSLAVPAVTVAGANATAILAAPLTSATGFAKQGDGRLILARAASYAGSTSVVAGGLESGNDDVLPDGTLLVVDRFAEVDFAGFRDTVGGLEGLGMVTIGPALTIAVAGSDEVRFDGALGGSGDVIIDSPGSGPFRFDATAESIDDKSEKTYTGTTLVRRGSLAVSTNAVPLATSGVEVRSQGRLILATDGGDYIFGSGGATAVTLAGGRLEQAPGTSVTLANTLAVTADSRILIATTPEPDPLAPTIEQLTLSGPLTGPAGVTLTIAASNVTPAADEARVNFVSVAGNTFAGSVSPEVNTVARFQGNYGGTSVVLAGGRVEGWGELQAISGSGAVSPTGMATGQGVLTAESLAVAADTSFVFGFTRTNLEPNWSLPENSDNDAVRLTGATPLPVALGSGNTVQLFLQVGELVEDDAFYGGFLTRTDTTALITGGSFETYVLGDGKGSDAFHDNRGFYSLPAFNVIKGSELVASVTMTALKAPFVGVTKEDAFLMTATYVPDTGPIVIDVPSGVQTQAEAGRPLLQGGRGVIKTGGGTLVVDQANTHTGTTTVQGGTLRLDNAAGLQASPVVVSGGTLEIDVDASLRSLVVDGGAAVLAAGGRVVEIESLSVAPGSAGGLLDLGRGRVNVAAGGISPADLRADIIAGRNGGTWDGLSGITSSDAAADGRFGVGYVIDQAGGASVAWALLGDADLDGLVDFDDILALFPNYNAPGVFTWQQGDFTYDGVVDFDDILALFPNYQTSVGAGSAWGAFGGMPAGGGTPPIAVPEPSAGMLAMLAGVIGLLRIGRLRTIDRLQRAN